MCILICSDYLIDCKRIITVLTFKNSKRFSTPFIADVKNAFKVLVFPESRMFQCENTKEKVRLILISTKVFILKGVKFDSVKSSLHLYVLNT